jgi:hypothetical protein
MTLFEICNDIAIIEEKLINGEIEFSYGKLMSAMKAGHPADILDDILSIIGWDVYAGKEPPVEKVKETLSKLQSFQKTFKVDLKEQIKNLKEYVDERSV